MSYKKFSILVFVFAAILIGLFFVAFYLYDPMQIFHKPFFREPTFSREMRLQNKGIIDHYDFDSYIVGDSLTINIPAGYVGYRLGGKWANISMTSSSVYEKYVLIKYLHQKKKVKSIIYGFNLSNLELGDKTFRGFGFLYDKNPLNDIRAYINKKYIDCLLLLSKKPRCIGEGRDIETFNFWFSDPRFIINFEDNTSWFHSIEELDNEIKRLEYLRTKPRDLMQKSKEDISVSIGIAKEYIFDIAAQFPDTKFYILLPTFSTYYYRSEKLDLLLKYLELVRAVVGMGIEYPNVEFYTLDDKNDMKNLRNYQDKIHTNMDMNVKQIDWIAEKKGRITPQNIEAYIQSIQDEVEKYDLMPLILDLKHAKQKRMESKK
ncbi:hypothetical protein [Helicobacter anatolicus]|uniref:hypothetical protein n=1 Tax=Helicobacter anatolicus TaxID=2905874 RepID=UPI001E3BE6EA|nr:hypothetical protein [Helicobacter anatolicus]MCE3040040.1 hypothetical protein [Helicobacter anatolicus]